MSRPKEIDYARLETKAFRQALKGVKIVSTSRVDRILKEVQMQDASLRQKLAAEQPQINNKD